MKKDHDYVTMADYSADMAIQTEFASNIISNLKREKEDIERWFYAAIHAAGKIEISKDALFNDNLAIKWHDCPMTGNRIFEAAKPSGINYVGFRE